MAKQDMFNLSQEEREKLENSNRLLEQSIDELQKDNTSLHTTLATKNTQIDELQKSLEALNEVSPSFV